jgi:hypothetical protein
VWCGILVVLAGDLDSFACSWSCLVQVLDHCSCSLPGWDLGAAGGPRGPICSRGTGSPVEALSPVASACLLSLCKLLRG